MSFWKGLFRLQRPEKPLEVKGMLYTESGKKEHSGVKMRLKKDEKAVVLEFAIDAENVIEINTAKISSYEDISSGKRRGFKICLQRKKGLYRFILSGAGDKEQETYANIAKNISELTTISTQVKDGIPVYTSFVAEYAVYSKKKNKYEKKAENIEISIVAKDHKYRIVLESDKSILHMQDIQPEATYSLDKEKRIFSWTYLFKDAKTENLAFRLTFIHKREAERFIENYNSFLYEIKNREKITSSARKYFEHMGTMQENDKELSSESEEESDKNTESAKSIPSEDEHPVSLAIGRRKHTFVSSGAAISILEQEDQNVLRLSGAIGELTFEDRKIVPKKMLVQGGDDSLIILDSTDSGSLLRLDVNKEQISEKWELNQKVNDYFESKKDTDSNTFVGISDSSLYRIDPRSKSKIVEDQMMKYATNNKFSYGSTTASGDIVVCSQNGELRLYDKINKRAKTRIPGFGDKVRGIDTTRNGRYIVCTYDTYLLFIDTEKNASSGYHKSIANTMSPPRRLQLRPEHVSLIGSCISFTPARFSTEADDTQEDTKVVASTGTYLIIWKVSSILQDRLFDYRLKRFGKEIVTNNFLYEDGKHIILAHKNEVALVSEKCLSNPKRIFK